MGQRGSELLAEDAALARAGVAILDANWLGHATRASSRLYPHQWSWDAACIAIAYSHFDQARAETELRSLFEGQWRNGLLPHIRFTDGARYFPGPEFWQTELSPDAPAHPRTSGIVQPPVHATAVWQVYRNAADIERAEAFLRELMPQLAAWHDYLYRERTRDGEGLVEIWHPWESGIDNSPLWDEALGPDRAAAGGDPRVPARRHRGRRLVAAADERRVRPLRLPRQVLPRAGLRPGRGSAPSARSRSRTSSSTRSSSRAGEDLASIARVVGEDPEPFERAAATTRSSLDSKLWSEAGRHVPRLRPARRRADVAARTWGGLAPLYCGVVARAGGAGCSRPFASSPSTLDGGWAVPSVSADDPSFDPARYWRGPVWPMISWVIYLGLRRHGFDDEAEQLRSTQLDLARGGGFWEHYNAKTGEGQGTEHLSWTAAIVLDLLLARPGDTPVLTRISGERS